MLFLMGCPEEKAVINKIQWEGNVPTGWIRFASSYDLNDAGTYQWGENDDIGPGITTIYISQGISGFENNPNLGYVVVVPAINKAESIWHTQCQEQILNDLKKAGVTEPEKRWRIIIENGNNLKMGQAPPLNIAFQEAKKLLTGSFFKIDRIGSTQKTTWGKIKK